MASKCQMAYEKLKMNSFIPLARPNLLENDIELVTQVLRSGMLVQGRYVEELEKVFIEFTGSSNASALSNGTATLHLSLIALGIGPGDEVIVPAFSYVATANVVELVGAKPIFVDIDSETFNISISAIEKAISGKTRAIIPVHEFGLACNIGAIMEIAEKHRLHVIEDAACALGAKFKGRHVGSFGSFGSFSLHPRKAISSGEGGVLITSDSALDKQVKILRNHGIETVDGQMEFSAFGFNYRMTDFQAALVVSQSNRLESSIAYKRELASVYFEELNQTRLRLPVTPGYTEHTWQTFHVMLDVGINRNQLILDLKDKGIGANYGAQCIPYMKVYRQKYGLNCETFFPHALAAYKHGLALPLHDLVTKEHVKYISSTIKKLIS